MKKNIRKKLILISILSILILSLLFLFLKDNTLTIGTGSEKGIYYPTGLAISEIINKYSNYQSITSKRYSKIILPLELFNLMSSTMRTLWEKPIYELFFLYILKPSLWVLQPKATLKA